MPTDYHYALWRGDIGPGLWLRESIALDNAVRESERRSMTVEAKPIAIDQDVRDLIRGGTWSTTKTGDPALTMPMTSDRKLYQKTAKVLTSLGGTWSKKDKATVFDDEDAESAVREACETGAYIDFKKHFQFYETPDRVIEVMFEELDIKPRETAYTVLEPSAGHGAIIKALAAKSTGDTMFSCTAIEVDPEKHKVLEELTGSPHQILGQLVSEDFLKCSPEKFGYFDYVIMNPPFTKSQDVQHVRHAYEFLKPGGKLVAVMSPGFTYRKDMTHVLFREWLYGIVSSGRAWHYPLPDNSFRSSGTNVRSMLLYIQKGK